MRTRLLLTAALAGLVVCGCRKSLCINHVPEFLDNQVHRVAVLPFDNRSGYAAGGDIVAGHLAEQLRATGTYDVIAPLEVRQRLGLPPCGELGDMDEDVLVARIVQATGADAYIRGEVQALGSDENPCKQWRDDDNCGGGIYEQDRWGWGCWNGWGYDEDWSLGICEIDRAFVGARAQLVRASDGAVLANARGRATRTRRSYWGSWRENVLTCAVVAASRQIAEGLAIVPVEVKVDAGQALRTAKGPAPGGRWRYGDDFKSDQTLFVLVRLPADAERNTFDLEISPDGQPQRVLASQELYWETHQRQAVVEFPLAPIADRGGKGEYRVHLLSGGLEGLSRDFEIH